MVVGAILNYFLYFLTRIAHNYNFWKSWLRMLQQILMNNSPIVNIIQSKLEMATGPGRPRAGPGPKFRPVKARKLKS